MKASFFLSIIYLLFLQNSLAQIVQYKFETYAGGKEGFADGNRKNALFFSPEGIAVDKKGNVYVTEYRTSIVRKIDFKGNVKVIGGQAMKTGYADGKLEESLFDRPHGLAVDKNGTVYVCDMKNHLIRTISKDGIVGTFAGVPKEQGTDDGYRLKAKFNQPEGIAINSKGEIFVADTYNFTIRKIDNQGNVTTFAGTSGKSGYADGMGKDALFDMPLGIAIDKNDVIFVADANYDGDKNGNNIIRKIDKNGIVSTFCGVLRQAGNKDGLPQEALFHRPVGIATTNNGFLYIADTEGDVIRKIDSKGNVSTLGGQYLQEKTLNGIGKEAAFFDPQSIAVSQNGDIYLADTHNSRIVKGIKIITKKKK
jgi:hypothetical protein